MDSEPRRYLKTVTMQKMEDMGSSSESMNGSMKWMRDESHPCYLEYFFNVFYVVVYDDRYDDPQCYPPYYSTFEEDGAGVCSNVQYVFVSCRLSHLLGGFSLLLVFRKFLEFLGLISGMMMQFKSTKLSGALLIVAGAYQFTPLKNACLEMPPPIDFCHQTTEKVIVVHS